MNPYPLRLLLFGYAIALAGATALSAAGGGAVISALSFWIGGAVATLALAAGAARASREAGASADRDEADAAAAAAALAAWEQDRRRDLPVRETHGHAPQARRG